MNIYTFKLTKKTMIIAAAAAVVLLIVLIAVLFSGKDKAVSTAAVKGMTNKQDLIDYVTSLGYTVSESEWKSKEVVIPSKFDKVYTEYNEMQKKCGFDLSDYKGKKVALHTLSITNYKGANDVLCDLIVYKDTIIGGSIYTADVSGFMHGLTKNK